VSANGGPRTLSFNGQVALVTGAGRGLGRAYAELLGARGATVIATDLAPTSVDLVDGGTQPAVLAAIAKAGGTAEIRYADLSDEMEARQLARDVLRDYGRVEIIILNAGNAVGTLDEHLDLHLRSPVWVTEEIWDSMVQNQYGRILITTAGVGLFGSGAGGKREGDTVPNGFGARWLYGPPKAGVMGLMRHLANRGKTVNIRVNAISPIAFTAAMRDATKRTDPESEARLEWIRTVCTPESAAPVAAYLVHADCPVTGEIWRAAGGHVGRIFIAETPGITLESLTIEDVRDNIDAIRDESGYTVPAHSGTG
jgi:NAD(P)-dependent dehydrogenase (short-subunit alcohol dehydrogenase family)